MIWIDKSSKLPVYVQIYRSIREDIIKGNRKAGDHIESVRALSDKILVSKNTILKAYQQLVSEGFIENHPKSGYIVVDIQQYIKKGTFPISIANSLKKDTKYIKEKILKKKDYRYDFSYHKMSMQLYSNRRWKQCFDEALLGYDIPKFGQYCDSKGEYELRNEIKKYLNYSRNIECDIEQIIICSGLQESIEKICRIMRPQIVALECPNLPYWKRIFEAHEFPTIPISVYPENNYVDELEKSKAKLAIMTPSHQFPTGYTLTLEERMRLLEWGEQADGIIIEDDYDCEFRYSSQPLSAVKSMDQFDRVLYIGTFSKILLPGLRISYMILPYRLLKIHDEIYQNYPPSVAWITQKALYHFITHDGFLRHILRTRKILKQKYELITNACRECFGNEVEIIGTDAGLHILLRVKRASTEEDLIEKAMAYDVRVYSIKDYWNGEDECPNNLVLLGFSFIEKSDILNGIKCLSEAWKEYL